MLGECFYWLFNMSIIASFTGLLILLIRRIHVIPRRITIFLWAVPFIRMCIPLGLNSPYSLMSLFSRFTTKTITVFQPTDNIAFSITNSIRAANSYFPITYKVNILENIFEVSSLIWIAVALAIIVILGLQYITSLRKLKNAKPIDKNVYLSDKLEGPAVYGIINPKIVLPSLYEGKDDIQYILRHETAHIQRADNLWRLFAFFAAALHWFNPLSWIFLKLFLADIELACDERAIAKYDQEERKKYAQSLLHCAQSKNLFPSSFGGPKIKTRIENILSYKQLTSISAVSFTILMIIIIYVLITNTA